MDFQCAVYDSADKSYYDMSGTKLVESQIRDVLMGIRAYRRERPDGFLEIRPFLGVDVRHYTLDELAAFLEATFEGYERGETASIAAFAAMKDHNPDSPVPGRFAGIKVYPPLGFDPLPGEGTERDKTELLWSFCEARDVPIVTHCDDQGFRIVGLEEAWRNTSPARWEPVLRSHPKLRLDFAHFGAQYSHPLGRPLSTEWTDRIVRLMVDFPNVYADFSFDGSEPEYYRWLEGYLAKCSRGLASQIEDRLLFGSDFMVNLVKIRSYAEYYRLFAGSPLSDELIRRFGHDNPERFLFA
jgi:Predicted metal-dependent hydrolase of the TIM-barrel fold